MLVLHVRRALVGATAAACLLGPTLAAAPAYGAVRLAATVQVDGSLNVRTGASTATRIVGVVRNRARISVVCSVPGQRIRGTVRATNRWDRLTNGRYVSDAYVRRAKAVPACPPARTTAGTGTPTTVTGTVRSTDGPVRLRTGPTTAYPVQGTAASGSRLTLVCAVGGQTVTGTVRRTDQWDRLPDGRYISHAYVSSASLPRCTGTVPAPPETRTDEEFIAAAVAGAQQGWREFGVPASVTIGQAILESGWGRSALSSTHDNYFGIKCFGGPGVIAAGCHTYQTFECTKAGTCYTTSASFRTYRTPADSFRDHGHFLRNNTRYQPAFAHSGDADEFLRQIWQAGYATDPEYVEKVTGLMKTYDLYRYDR